MFYFILSYFNPDTNQDVFMTKSSQTLTLELSAQRGFIKKVICNSFEWQWQTILHKLKVYMLVYLELVGDVDKLCAVVKEVLV